MRDAAGKPYVEMVECLRVFPDRFRSPGSSEPLAGNLFAQPFDNSLQDLLKHAADTEAELQRVCEQLEAEREKSQKAESMVMWFQEHTAKLAEQNSRLLAAPTPFADRVTADAVARMSISPKKPARWFGWLRGRS